MTSAASQFGALPLPIPAPGTGETVADPGLDVLLAFAKAVLIASANTAHQTVDPGTEDVVKTTRAHNPGQVVFSEKELPALFGWRISGESTTEADDYEIETSKITLLWILPPAQQEHLAARGPIVHGLAKALTAALKRSRHPAWIKGGDTDPQAATRGSFLWEWAGWWAFDKVTWKLQELIATKGGTDATYPGVQFDLTVRERVFLGQSTDPLKAALTVHLPDEEDNPLVSLELT